MNGILIPLAASVVVLAACSASHGTTPTGAAVQGVLVANGASLFLSIVSNTDHPEIDALLTSDCSTANIPACKTLLESLDKASSAIPGTNADPTTDPAVLQALEAGKDPAWTIDSFMGSDMTILP